MESACLEWEEEVECCCNAQFQLCVAVERQDVDPTSQDLVGKALDSYFGSEMYARFSLTLKYSYSDPGAGAVYFDDLWLYWESHGWDQA